MNNNVNVNNNKNEIKTLNNLLGLWMQVAISLHPPLLTTHKEDTGSHVIPFPE